MKLTIAVALIVVAFTVLTGCGDSAKNKPAKEAGKSAKDGAKPADPNDLPLTDAEISKLKSDVNSYDAAVKRIKAYRDTIRDSIAANKPTEAHRALDELDLVLGWLPQLAKGSGVAKEHWEDVSTSSQTLRDSFNEVHAAIDAKKDPDYKGVADKIDAAVAKIEAVPAETK